MLRAIALVLGLFLANFQSVISKKYNGDNDIVLIHIPKTAGTSFERDIMAIKTLLGDEVDEIPGRKSFKGHFQDYQNEKCYYVKYSKSDFNVMLFRNPRDHVYSQYLEIKWDPKFQRHHFTDGTRFPRNYTDEVGFDLWVTYFDLKTWGVIYTGDYHTYNPINMQTRYLTCHVDGHHIDKFPPEKTIQDVLPKVPEAKQNLRTIDLVGITEFYPTFMCIFIYKTFNHLPKPCSCDYVQKTNSSFQTHKELHGIPRHAWQNLPINTVWKVDNITALDREIYEDAMNVFLEFVEETERATKKKILCPGNVRELLGNSLSYLNLPNLRKRAEDFK